ncbi:DUF3006 domain-containing protein [Oceanobacillus massiliensis]|uniref:DUF3006 domain-containing protein n=1 Tax=Oceanobacillus massiliensis TaxID=1465765 RepID=UPI001376043D|nr:DUF3006 domain-containing protein [Oceanobacillus massiliensis]
MKRRIAGFVYLAVAAYLIYIIFIVPVFTEGNEPEKEIIGFIDRFENEMAVVLIEESAEEIYLPTSILPPTTKENTYLIIQVPVTPRILSKNN